MGGLGMRYAYTAETLAKAWGVSAATVRTLVRQGELRAFRVGRQIRIRPEAVEEYEASHIAEDDRRTPRAKYEQFNRPLFSRFPDHYDPS
jgi:excisionase family DNA binding protein